MGTPLPPNLTDPPITNKSKPINEINNAGVAKQYAYWILINYREAYDMFLVNGILFNHEVHTYTHTHIYTLYAYNI